MGIFQDFPIITRNKYISKSYTDITRRAFYDIKDKLQSQGLLQTYTIQSGERPEDVAFKVYGNPELYWIIFILNNIINPYTDWYMSEDVFEKYLLNKYPDNTARLVPNVQYIAISNSESININNLIFNDPTNTISFSSGATATPVWLDVNEDILFVNNVTGIIGGTGSQNGEILETTGHPISVCDVRENEILTSCDGSKKTLTVKSYLKDIQYIVISDSDAKKFQLCPTHIAFKSNRTNPDDSVKYVLVQKDFTDNVSVKPYIYAPKMYNSVPYLNEQYPVQRNTDRVDINPWEQTQEIFDPTTAAGPISNFLFEFTINESKKQIILLPKDKINVFEKEFRERIG